MKSGVYIISFMKLGQGILEKIVAVLAQMSMDTPSPQDCQVSYLSNLGIKTP